MISNTYTPMKTPVSILQELLSRRGITPTYELVQIEGAIHEPTFRYRVSFNDKEGEVPFTAMGAGRSKKEAKHAAAKALIDKITGVISTDPPAISNGTSSELVLFFDFFCNFFNNFFFVDRTSAPGNNNTSFEDKVNGNPIGLLQEMCMSRRWPPPTYETGKYFCD